MAERQPQLDRESLQTILDALQPGQALAQGPQFAISDRSPVSAPFDPLGGTADIIDMLSPFLDPQVLTDATFQARYGVNAADKLALANTGAPLGVSPEQAQIDDPLAADRAAAAQLGAQQFGLLPAMFFNEIRQTLGGDAPEDRQRLRDAAILGASRSVGQQEDIPGIIQTLLQLLGVTNTTVRAKSN